MSVVTSLLGRAQDAFNRAIEDQRKGEPVSEAALQALEQYAESILTFTAQQRRLPAMTAAASISSQQLLSWQTVSPQGGWRDLSSKLESSFKWVVEDLGKRFSGQENVVVIMAEPVGERIASGSVQFPADQIRRYTEEGKKVVFLVNAHESELSTYTTLWQQGCSSIPSCCLLFAIRPEESYLQPTIQDTSPLRQLLGL